MSVHVEQLYHLPSEDVTFNIIFFYTVPRVARKLLLKIVSDTTIKNDIGTTND